MTDSPFRFRVSLFSGLLSAAFAAIFTPALADTIVMKQAGKRIEGLILDQNEQSVRIQTSSSIITIPRSAIQEIIETDQISEAEKSGDRLNQAGQSDQALEVYRKALETGVGRDRVQGKIDELESAIALREERMYAERLSEAQKNIEAGRYDDAIRQLGAILGEAKPGLYHDKVNHELARAHYEKARGLLDTVRYDLAQAELRLAIATDPGYREAYLALAELLRDSTLAKDEAKTFFAKAYELKDPDFDALSPAEKREEGRHIYNWAELLNRDKEYLAAAELYQKVLSAGLSRDFPFAVDRLVQAYVNAGQTRQAENAEEIIAALKKAVDFVDAPLRAYYFLAQLYYEEKRYDEAIEPLKNLLTLDAKYPEANYLLAECYHAQKQNDLYYKSLLAESNANPGHYNTQVEIGEFLLAGAKYAEALDYFDKAIAINSGPLRAHLGRAEALRKLGQLDEAQSVCTDMLGIDPANPNTDVVRELGLVYFDQQNYVEATTQFLTVMTTLEGLGDKRTPEQTALLAEAATLLGDVGMAEKPPSFNKAQEFYAKATKFDPKLARAYQGMGDAFVALKQPENAESSYAEAIRLEPEEPTHYLAMAILYHRHMENPKEALPYYLKYLELGGKDVENVSRYVRECGGSPGQTANLDIAKLRARINQRRLVSNLAVSGSMPPDVANGTGAEDSASTSTLPGLSIPAEETAAQDAAATPTLESSP